MGRRKVHDRELRLRLLDRAGEVLSSAGPEGLSLRRLASAAGTSTTAVYSLFGGKRQLLHQVRAEALRRFAAHLRTVRETADPTDDLIRLALAYRASAVADPHYYRVLFDSAPDHADLAEPGYELYGETFGLLVACVRRCMEAGQLSPREPAIVAHALWGYVHGLVLIELNGFTGAFGLDPAGSFAEAIRTATAGWAPPEPAKG